MIDPGPSLGTLLLSPTFAAARRTASEAADDPEHLRVLLARVDAKTFGIGDLDAIAGRLDVDIACSIVTARVEELEQDSVPRMAADLSPTASSRLRLVIAALEYFVVEHDVVPDGRPTGHLDDLTVVRWATQLAQETLPGESS